MVKTKESNQLFNNGEIGEEERKKLIGDYQKQMYNLEFHNRLNPDEVKRVEQECGE